MTKNPYVPYPVTIAEITIENEAKDLKTFKLVFDHEPDRAAFSYLPGQFAELSLFGYGEAPVGIASSPTEQEFVMFSVKRAGVVTSELHRSEPGRKMGVRGPLGNPFPWDRMEGCSIVVVGGGFAFTTLRSAITYMLAPDQRSRFKTITVIYGARSPGELMYKPTLKEWEKSPDLDLCVTVDKGEDGWTGREGFVPAVLEQVGPSAENAICLVCGPPIMIKFTMPVLRKLGFAERDIFLSLEMRMKCGIGKCGRCNIGRKYVCIDGPVFSCEELSALPAEF
ncbi:MAG: FAD/NAD(P)-binding protein [Kiritimatiellae bacterium]|nr:FAD/NAD(P)-binding protein [Kiritimatiellia bacterium]